MPELREFFQEVDYCEDDEQHPGDLDADDLLQMGRNTRVVLVDVEAAVHLGVGCIQLRNAKIFEHEDGVDGEDDAVDEVGGKEHGEVEKFDLRPFKLKKKRFI